MFRFYVNVNVLEFLLEYLLEFYCSKLFSIKCISEIQNVEKIGSSIILTISFYK